MHWRISQDGLFGLNEANVACRQLGFPLGAIEPVKGYHPYPISYVSGRSTLISNVSCGGNETRLQDCSYRDGGALLRRCGQYSWIKVRCAGKTDR